ncbi:PAS domain-containing protein [Azospirillum argentinense]
MNAEELPASFRRFWNRTIVLPSIALIMLALGTGAWLWLDRARTLFAGERSAHALARVLEEQTARGLQAVDLTLTGIIDTLTLSPGLREHDPAFESTLRQRLHALPQVWALTVVGPSGFITQSTGSSETPPFSVADRDYFNAHISDPSPGLRIGKPLVSRSAGVSFISMSRRITRPDGSFGGVAVAAIEPRYFERFYRELELGEHDRIALFRRDGVLLVGSPYNEAVVGKDYATMDLFQTHLPAQEHGTYRLLSIIDRTPRIISYRAVPGFPLVVTVGLAEHELLAGWRRNAVVISVVAGLVAALSILLVTLWVRRHDERAQILQKQADAHAQAAQAALKMAAVLESTTDAVMELDRDWRVIFMNDRAKSSLGGRGDLGQRVFWDAYPEFIGTEFWCCCRQVLNAGGACEVELAGPLIGQHFFARAFPSRDGLVVFFQDITARRRAERERERLAQELERERTLLKGVLDHLPSGVFATAAPDGRLLLHNPAAERLIGHPVHMAKTFDDYAAYGAVHPDGTPYQPDEYPLARALRYGETVAYGEMRYRRGDGTIATFTFSAAPVRDANGRIIMAVAIFHDISERKVMEEALRRSEERLAFALASARAGTFDTDLRTRTIIWSAESYRLFGMEPNGTSINLDTWFDLIHPEDRRRVLSERARIIRETDPIYRVEHRVLRPDGSMLWISVLGRFVFDPDGTPVRASGLYIDITAHKQAEEALRQSEERLNFALASANAGIWDWDIRSGALTWSEGVYTLYGLVPEQFTPTYEAWLPWVHPDDRDHVQHAVRAALASTNGDYTLEHRIRHPSRGERWLMNVGRVLRDHDGLPQRLTGVSLDITERKGMEDSVLRSQERLRDALVAARAGSWEWNLKTGEVFWSEENQVLFGLPAGLIAAGYEVWLRTVVPEDREQADWIVHDALSTGQERFQIEFRVRLSEGEIRWLIGMGRIRYDADGHPTYITGLNVDITERRRMEEELRGARREAERANVAKSKFLAAASHDLRQPLQALFLFAATLHGHVQTARGQSVLTTLERNLETLKGLLDSLLDVSRLDAEVIRPNIESFLLSPALDDIGDSFAPVALQKGLDFQIDIPREVTVRSDRHLLDRMIRNLIENAIKYTERGRIRLECRVVDEGARITVRDTGIGIAPDHLDTIFLEFHQIGNPERDRTKGLGLGLSIVQRLAKLLEHPVTVRSTLGQGSEFTVDVPLGEVAAVQYPEPFAAVALHGGGRLAVLIDDEDDVLLGLCTIFHGWGFDTVVGSSAEQALDRLKADGRVPAVIVSDYRLAANKTGVDAVCRIRDQVGVTLPGMVLTGETAAELRGEVAKQGLEIVIKPVVPRRLHEALMRLLDGAA